MISRLKIPVILITKQNGLLKKLDITKYQQQYHSGAGINHAGSRTFSINLLEDDIVKQTLFQNINKISKKLQVAVFYFLLFSTFL